MFGSIQMSFNNSLDIARNESHTNKRLEIEKLIFNIVRVAIAFRSVIFMISRYGTVLFLSRYESLNRD